MQSLNLALAGWAGKGRKIHIPFHGGLVTALLGRIPKSGDVAHLRNLKFTVEKVRKRRIETLILSFEPFTTNGQ